jgi:hypothetical protein
MSRRAGSVLLVGSVPGETAAEVLRTCGEGVGNYVTCLPDGETGYRRMWIHFLATTIYHGHPALETIQRPKPTGGKERWHVEEYGEEGWLFKVKEGVEAVHFDHLGYANEARKSYQDFCTLRAEGVIPPGVRFQVSLPLTESAIRSFLTNARDYECLRAAYEEAMGREIAHIVKAIPANDLAIQWDICVEVLAIALQDQFGAPWQPSGDPFGRYLQALTTLAPHVPEQTLMGCHLCYGDLGHKHLVEPTDLGLVVRMATAAHKAVPRRIDYYHLPVPRNRDDAAYFAPLKDLETGDAKLYLGLVHHTDGVEGALRRVRTARRYVSGFGVATECGFGRRPKETIPELLRIHREVVAALGD